MMKSLTYVLAALALTACEAQPAGEPFVRKQLGESSAASGPVPEPSPVPALANGACKPVTFEDIALTHCIADPSKHRILTAQAPTRGKRAGTIAGWRESGDAEGLVFATNAGMYGDDLRPVGYFVSNGERSSELDTGTGTGNFYLKPNGVFYGSGDEWRILSSEQFLSNVRDRPQFGTQSGPMLVIDGELHPEISQDGPSRKVRNGIGLDSEGRAHFVLSQAPLSFGKLARFYRDELGVDDALYLDGGPASNLLDPAAKRMDGGRVGPLLVVIEKDG